MAKFYPYVPSKEEKRQIEERLRSDRPDYVPRGWVRVSENTWAGPYHSIRMNAVSNA